MNSLNRVQLLGNLGKDAELNHTQNGTEIVKFSLATTHSTKDPSTGDWQDKTDWHNVVLWRGGRVAQYLRKGTKVFVEGRLQTRTYEKDGERRFFTEVVANSAQLILLGSRDQSAPPQGVVPGQQPAAVPTPQQSSYALPAPQQAPPQPSSYPPPQAAPPPTQAPYQPPQSVPPPAYQPQPPPDEEDAPF